MIIDVEEFRILNILSTSPFEPYEVYIKNAYRCTSQRLQSGKEDTVNVLENNQGCGELSVNSRKSGNRQIVIQEENRVMSNGPFLVPNETHPEQRTG